MLRYYPFRINRFIGKTDSILRICLYFYLGITLFAQTPPPAGVSEKLEIKFPLTYIEKTDGKVSIQETTLTITPIPTNPTEGPKITFNSETPGEAQHLAILPHLQVASLQSAFVIESPWSSIDFSINTAESADYSGSTATLGVAMIAAAHRKPWPEKTAILAELRPDTSLSPIPQLKLMAEKLADYGIKKIVTAPDVHPDSGYKNAEEFSMWCQSKGIKYIPARHLRDATRLAYDLDTTNLKVDAFSETMVTNLTQTIERESKLRKEKSASIDPTVKLKGVRKAKGGLNPDSLMEDAAKYKARAEEASQKNEWIKANELFLKAHLNIQMAKSIAGSTPETDTDRLLVAAQSTRNQLNNLLFEIPDRDPQLNNVLRWTLLEEYLNDLYSGVETSENILSKTRNYPQDSKLPSAAREDLDIIQTSVKSAIAEEPTPLVLMTGIAQMDKTLPYALNGRQIFAQVSPALEGYAELLARDLLDISPQARDNLISDWLFVFTLNRWSEKAAKTYYSKYYSDRRVRLAEENLQGNQFSLGGGYMPPIPKPKPLPVDNISYEFQIFYDLGNISRLGFLREMYGIEDISWAPSKFTYSIDNPKMLNEALEQAEPIARFALNKIADKPLNLTPLIYLYEKSKALSKEPEAEFKIQSLMGFWRVSLMAMTLKMMTFENLSEDQKSPAAPALPNPSALPVPSEL